MPASTPSKTTFVEFFKMTITIAGTREALPATSQPIKGITIAPWSANTGKVYVGGVDIASTTDDGWTSTDSVRIAPGRGYVDPTEIYLDVSVSGEGANIIYMLQ